jgi:outer membrane protein OmpA-like peptidoglycan-associated protein
MNARLLTGLGLTLALGACATTPQPNAALEDAHAAVQAAETDPNVAKYAPLDLEAAKRDLTAADEAAAHHNDQAISQHAYLATQSARLAQAHGATKANDARVAAGQTERDHIMLAARNREVNDAKDQRDQATVEAARATGEAARLQAEVDQLKGTATSRGLVLTLGDVMFDTGKAELKSGADRKLDQLVQFLNEHQDRHVQIDGFTDSVGSDSYNEELSQRRADAVKSALLSRGIDASRISTQGYGKAFPVASNGESGGRQLNRRVEVVIGSDGRPIAPRG